MTQISQDKRSLTPVSVLSGLLFRPTGTMWRLRDEGPLWLSLGSAWVLGGLGLPRGLLASVAIGVDQPLWVYWLCGVAMYAAEFGATMLLVHLSAFLVWRGSSNPVMTAGMRTLLRVGGYWSLPSSLVSLVLSILILLAARLGSVVVLKTATVVIIPLALAGWVWTAVFRLGMLRTVYLTTWSQAIAIGIILVILGTLVRVPMNRIIIGPESAIARVDWDLHRSLGADPDVITALESIPQANSWLRILLMSRTPEQGDLVAYYRDRKAPAVHRGTILPKPIVIGRVLAGPGQEAASVEVWLGETVPEEYLLVRPVADPRDPPHPPELVTVDSVAGEVPESDLRMHIWVTRLLLR